MAYEKGEKIEPGIWRLKDSKEYLAKLVGHRDIRITMRYAHLAPEHLQAAVDALVLRRLPGTLQQGTDS